MKSKHATVEAKKIGVGLFRVESKVSEQIGYFERSRLYTVEVAEPSPPRQKTARGTKSRERKKA